MAEDDSKGDPLAAATVKHVAKQAEAVRKSASHLEASAGAVERSASDLTDSADRRTVLAADRTVLAAERTYAAWIRTGLVALASGIGARALMQDHLPRWLAMGAAIVMICFSIFCYFSAIWRNLQRVAPPQPDVRRLPGRMFVIFALMMVLVSAASLVGILLP